MKVLVVGSGTAGLMSALAIKKTNPEIQIQVLSTEDISVIRVGESTTNLVRDFLFGYLGINMKEFFNEVRPGFKVGIRFFWGDKETPYFDHQFDPMFLNQVGSSGYSTGDLYFARSGETGNVGSELMKHNLSPIKTGNYNSINYALHLENASFIKYLTKIAKERGIEFLEKKLCKLTVDSDTNDIKQVICTDGSGVEADYFINCGGFSSPLSSHGNNEFQSYEKLLCNAAVFTNVERKGKEIKNYTGVHTMTNGWCWEIHHPDSISYGYVHCNHTISLEEATEELYEKIGERVPVRDLKFNSGRRQKALIGNLANIGNAYGFAEPLQSMSIELFCVASMEVSEYLRVTKGVQDNLLLESVNKIIEARYQNNFEFVQFHYKHNNKLDTDFWKLARSQSLPQRYINDIATYRRYQKSGILLVLGDNRSEIEQFGNIFKGVTDDLERPLIEMGDWYAWCTQTKQIEEEVKSYLTIEQAYADIGMVLNE